MANQHAHYDLAPRPDAPLKESDIENALLGKLDSLKYSPRPDIRDRSALEANFRGKFEQLNAVTLSDSEFARLLDQITTADVYKSAQTLRTRNSFERDDGTPLNFTLVNIRDWCKNDFEFVNQLRINTQNSHQRYDVILLINGIPCVQIELKTLEISPRRAMQQIVEYKTDPGNGYTNTLLSFMQLFIVSNRTNTYYFANNNSRHFEFDAKERFLPVYQWADRENRKINNLDRFAETFLPKCTLGHMISRYMVLVAGEQKLLMMRPYQVYQVKSIVDCIHQDCGNGFIWSTTGSGKTLTSFKASILLKDNPDIEKCLFVVDRKDLDRQTREEFNKFQEGCVEENTNTHTLVRRLLSTDYADKVIVTTIQNLNDRSAEFNYSQEPVPERNRVESGDLLFAWSGTLGSSFGARIWNGPSGVLNQHIFKVLIDQKEIILHFALLVLARVEEDIARRTHGFKASFVHVKKSDLVKVELLLPSLAEQQRIATCLSSLDALITAETQKLEALKQDKKGLMQKLFPNPELSQA